MGAFFCSITGEVKSGDDKKSEVSHCMNKLETSFKAIKHVY